MENPTVAEPPPHGGPSSSSEGEDGGMQGSITGAASIADAVAQAEAAMATLINDVAKTIHDCESGVAEILDGTMSMRAVQARGGVRVSTIAAAGGGGLPGGSRVSSQALRGGDGAAAAASRPVLPEGSALQADQHPLFDRAAPPGMFPRHPWAPTTRKAVGGIVSPLGGVMSRAGTGATGGGGRPQERGYTKEIIGTELAERTLLAATSSSGVGGGREEGGAATGEGGEGDAGEDGGASAKQRINDKARYLLLKQRRERMLSRKREYAKGAQYPNPARNPDQALTLALRRTAHKLEKLDIGVIRAFVPKFTVIRTFRHQWVYRESDKTVNPVFPNLREIYLPALECSAEQLANLLKILVAERGVETIVIDENALDFQRIRYLNELNRPTLMPLQSSIQQMYDECRALLLAACLDVDDPVQSQELMSAVHGGGRRVGGSKGGSSTTTHSKTNSIVSFDAADSKDNSIRQAIMGRDLGPSGLDSPRAYAFHVNPDILISSILDYFQLYTNLRVLSLRYCGIDEHSVKRLKLPASLQRLYSICAFGYLDGNPLLDMGLVYLLLANPHIFGDMPTYIMDIVQEYEEMNPDATQNGPQRSELETLFEEAATEVENQRGAAAADVTVTEQPNKQQEGGPHAAGDAAPVNTSLSTAGGRKAKQGGPAAASRQSLGQALPKSTGALKAQMAAETAAQPVDQMMDVDEATALRERVLQRASLKLAEEMDDAFSDFEEYAACFADGCVDDYREARHEDALQDEAERLAEEAEAAAAAAEAAERAELASKEARASSSSGRCSVAASPTSVNTTGGPAARDASTTSSRAKGVASATSEQSGATDPDAAAGGDDTGTQEQADIRCTTSGDEGSSAAGGAVGAAGGTSNAAASYPEPAATTESASAAPPDCSLEELSMPLTGLTYGDLLALLFCRNRSLKRLDVSSNPDIFLASIEAPQDCTLEQLRMEKCNLSAAELKLVFAAFERSLKAFSGNENPSLVSTRESKKKFGGAAADNEDAAGGSNAGEGSGGATPAASARRSSLTGGLGGRRGSFSGINGKSGQAGTSRPTFRRPSQLVRACQSREGALVDVLDIPWELGYMGLASCEIATSQEFVDLAWNFLGDGVFLDFSRNPDLGVQGLALLLYVLRGRADTGGADGYPAGPSRSGALATATAPAASSSAAGGAVPAAAAGAASASSVLDRQRARCEKFLHATTALAVRSHREYGIDTSLQAPELTKAEIRQLVTRKSIYAAQKAGGFPFRRFRDCVLDYRGCIREITSDEAFEKFSTIVSELEERWGIVVLSEFLDEEFA